MQRFTKGQVLTPPEMPAKLRAHYFMKVRRFGIKQGFQGVRYDGIQETMRELSPLYMFTVLDAGAHTTLAVKL